MGGLEDVPTFTALTYRATNNTPTCCGHIYQNLKPVAPVGLAFLLVWEENILSGTIISRRFYTCISAWDLPSGFSGTSHIVWCHATMGRRRPQRSIVSVEACATISTFGSPSESFPTQEECAYLF
jgi:hypothetical protein